MTAASFWIKPASWVEPSDSDRLDIIECLGKEPRGEYQIVVREKNNAPLVIENAPFFIDGTPMPTRYWLVNPTLVAEVSRVESVGGVKQVQDEIDHEVLVRIHDRYEHQRDALIAPEYDGPRPSAGVGGTRKGVKCLHAHVAHYLATGADEVGQWTMQKIADLQGPTLSVEKGDK